MKSPPKAFTNINDIQDPRSRPIYSFCLLVDIQALGKTCLPFTSGYVPSQMPWVGQIYLTWHNLKHSKRHVGSLPLCRIFVSWNVRHFKTSICHMLAWLGSCHKSQSSHSDGSPRLISIAICHEWAPKTLRQQFWVTSLNFNRRVLATCCHERS